MPQKSLVYVHLSNATANPYYPSVYVMRLVLIQQRFFVPNVRMFTYPPPPHCHRRRPEVVVEDMIFLVVVVVVVEPLTVQHLVRLSPIYS
jgi:hypothetical protein